jgi:hypothetical protein
MSGKMERTVVLLNGTRKRTYPLGADVELQDSYTLDGERWVVVAVLSTEDVPNPTFTGVQP